MQQKHRLIHHFIYLFGLQRPLKVNSGFTILELLTITLIISIITAIIAPSWLAFINHQRLRTSNNQVLWAMKEAQSNAKRDKTGWQTSIREQDGRVQIAVHAASTPPVQLPSTAWESLEPGVQIDDKQKNTKGAFETSFRKVDPVTNKVKTSGTVYRALFNYKGCPVYYPTDECTQTSLLALGTMTLRHSQLGDEKRCVIISTVIGAMRTGEDRSKPGDNDRFCY